MSSEETGTQTHTEERPREGTRGRWLSASEGERPRKDSDPADALILNFQPLELGENMFLSFKLASGTLLWQPEQTNTRHKKSRENLDLHNIMEKIHNLEMIGVLVQRKLATYLLYKPRQMT